MTDPARDILEQELRKAEAEGEAKANQLRRLHERKRKFSSECAAAQDRAAKFRQALRTLDP